jgi:hypothetical protein
LSPTIGAILGGIGRSDAIVSVGAEEFLCLGKVALEIRERRLGQHPEGLILSLLGLGLKETDCALVSSDLLFQVTSVEFGPGLRSQDLVLGTFGWAESGNCDLVGVSARFVLVDTDAWRSAIRIGGSRLGGVGFTMSAGLCRATGVAVKVPLEELVIFD